ncbi:MAG TPA: ATP-binding protein [Noviherbaspirillum sp.]|jgi:two-component system sensor histidine kinase RegB|uniref:ATP-binding protein n=1 Tax=Noviherbaspirillum sp. TaxID=1926288 RepID=UPI002F920451
MAGGNDVAVRKEGHARPGKPAAAAGHAAGHKNMLQLIQLRWLAVIGQVTTIAVVSVGLGIQLPLPQMLAVLACLIAFNIAGHLRLHKSSAVTDRELFFALLVDVGSLTAQLYFTGGTANPFAFLYLLQVILGAVLLKRRFTWTIVAVTSLCLAGLSLYSLPLARPPEGWFSITSLYVQGLLLCFVLNAGLLVFFVNRITENKRASDAMLADLRQRAAEEEHIVRMGLLASGAAHELGTPMATMSVILGDWKRMPEFAEDPDLQEEIAVMEAQLQRCKKIVSGILLSAGEARGESSARTTINTFLNDLVREWRAGRNVASFSFDNHIDPDLPVVFDSALKQTIFNLLDNASEASPDWVCLDARRKDGRLAFTVTDRGPGFAPEMLAQFGKPYQSSKGRPGGGLGLFLAVNVSRTLGGTVAARNRVEGGAEVELSLPLTAIALVPENADVR